MNWDEINRNWKHVSDRVKLTWGKLSDHDLTVTAGKRELLSGLLLERYGYTKQQAETKDDNFAQRLKPEDETPHTVGNIHQ